MTQLTQWRTLQDLILHPLATNLFNPNPIIASLTLFPRSPSHSQHVGCKWSHADLAAGFQTWQEEVLKYHISENVCVMAFSLVHYYIMMTTISSFNIDHFFPNIASHQIYHRWEERRGRKETGSDTPWPRAELWHGSSKVGPGKSGGNGQSTESPATITAARTNGK